MDADAYLIYAAIFAYPVWRIFSRTGNSGFFALFLLLPIVGMTVILLNFGSINFSVRKVYCLGRLVKKHVGNHKSVLQRFVEV